MTRYITLSQVVTFRGQIGVGKVRSGPYEYFGVVGFIVASLGKSQCAVQYLTALPLMTSGGQTARRGGECLCMVITDLMGHLMRNFQLDMSCHAHGLFLYCTSRVACFWDICYYDLWRSNDWV